MGELQRDGVRCVGVGAGARAEMRWVWDGIWVGGKAAWYAGVNDSSLFVFRETAVHFVFVHTRVSWHRSCTGLVPCKHHAALSIICCCRLLMVAVGVMMTVPGMAKGGMARPGDGHCGGCGGSRRDTQLQRPCGPSERCLPHVLRHSIRVILSKEMTRVFRTLLQLSSASHESTSRNSL